MSVPKKFWIAFFPFLVCVFLISRGNAQSVSQTDLSQGYILKTNVLGFGGAYRAIANTNDAIHLNPAGIALRKQKVAIAGDYLYNGSTSGHTFGVSITDYKATPIVALGLAYDLDMPSIGGNDATIQQVTLALAKDIGEIFYVGAAVKGYLTKIDSPFTDGPDGVDMDFGFLVRPIEYLSLALTLQNVAKGNDFEEFPFQMGFGLAVHLEELAEIAVDIVKDFKTPAQNDLNAFFGSQLRVGEGMYLRGGFGLDRIRDNNFWSVGAVTAGPKMNIGFTFSQRLNPTDQTYAVNLEMFF